MGELCKYCKMPLKFIRESENDGYDIFIYECHNEDCEKQPKLEIHVCQNCESEIRFWDDN